MLLQEYYKFQTKEFDDNGFHHTTNQWFMDVLEEYEVDFHRKHTHFYANHLFSNSLTMLLINKAIGLDPDESGGMDLINGKVDLETNLEIEKYSEIKTVYAIGSKLEENEDEPIFLVIDDNIPDGVILLKYISDDKSEDVEIQSPVKNDDKMKVH
jgi:hypothetical protein